MRRGDFNCAGALFGISVHISHNRDRAANQRQAHGLADQMPIARIIRVHRNPGVAKHGFGAGGGDHQVIAGRGFGDLAIVVPFDRVLISFAAFQRVAQPPHVAVHLDLLDLKIRDRGFKMRIPVHQPFAAVNQALVIHVDKYLDHRIGKVSGHGESVS